jgi:putative hydrolase of the HAD superfamily
MQQLQAVLRQPPLEWVLVDADDTLWCDTQYFRTLESEFDRLAVTGVVQSQPGALDALTVCLRDSVPGEAGFAACVRKVALSLGLPAIAMTELDLAITTFLDHPIDLLPMVRETLPLLANARRVLWTKGSTQEQIAKLQRSGLGAHFDDVRVVKKKDAPSLGAILDVLGATPNATLVIGNSVQHDVAPAIALGARAVWLDHAENLRGRNAELPIGRLVRVNGWEEIHVALSG